MENSHKQSPDFIGIGVMKAATTWIFQCLVEHPQVCDRSKKELHFFDKPQKYKKGIEFYLSFFQNCLNDKIKGEFTPAYIFSRQTPELIYRHFPNTKIIVCLRNPVDRVASHYKFNVYQNGRLSIYKNFSQAIRKDKEIVVRGKYYEQLKKYFDLFPKDNILVTIYEEIKNDPQKEISKIYEFLGVDPDFRPAALTRKANVTGDKKFISKRPLISKILYISRRFVPRESRREKALERYGLYDFFKGVLRKNKIFISKDQSANIDISIKNKDKEYLKRIYQEDIQKLEKLIGKDLSIWKK